MNIAPTAGQSLEDRKSTVTAKWRSVGKVDLTMFQSIADAWKNGELAVSIEDGKIKLTFVGDYGVPSDIYTLIKALGEVKPAHLPLEYNFKYLLIKEIHGVMNLTQTETQKLSKFAGGVFNE